MKPENTVWLVPKRRSHVGEIMAMVEHLGWAPAEDGDEYEWIVPDSDTTVRWIDDPDTHVEFFDVHGTDRDRVAAEIANTIGTLTVDDFEGHLARSDSINWVMPALYAIATAAPLNYDRRVATLFERYMRSPDPLIRRVTILALSITGWPEFVKVARRFLADPDPAIREAAEATLLDLSEIP
jgi:hypothetical protein